MMSNDTKPRALVFFQYLPPWRIDVFNEMATYYNLSIAFTDADSTGFTYDRQGLLNLLNPNIEVFFLNKGFKIGKRPVRLEIYGLLKKIQPAIVFSHEYSPTSILVANYKKLKFGNFKYVITTSDNLIMAQEVAGVKSFFRGYVLKRADALVVYSDKVKSWYLEHFPTLRIEVCPNIQNPKTLLANKPAFIDLCALYKQKFKISDEKILLFTGRLEHVKGLDLLLQAFSKSKNKGVKLFLVGEGSEKERLQQQCRELGIESNVVFAGFYSGKELYAWYEMAHGYVLPSRFEPFGAVVNEALVFGCPVLASKYIGATDFLDTSNGILFDPLNMTDFTQKLNEFFIHFCNTNEKERKNLMPVSFKDYVRVFHNVNT
ncbi:glycosyltransferase [uncultured Zobellia sp.]|uniref:glycosyltransferase n=1 Tax=uncultured Zobellia sp. TaxID=255433 RepID=UPI002595611F|nr:glycosyltransferase [uncultured Zobellia sp.]